MDLHWLTACEIAAAYAARKLSPVELLEALLARIATLDPKLNAFSRFDADFAIDAARLSERELFAGRSRGRLHGVPIGIKDIFDVAGLPTTCNIKTDARQCGFARCIRGFQFARRGCDHPGRARDA